MCVCRRANKDKNRSLLHIFAYMFDVWYSLYKRNTFFQPPHTKIGCFLPLPYKKYLWFSIIFMFEGEREKENVPHRFWIGCSSLFVCLWATEKNFLWCTREIDLFIRNEHTVNVYSCWQCYFPLFAQITYTDTQNETNKNDSKHNTLICSKRKYKAFGFILFLTTIHCDIFLSL